MPLISIIIPIFNEEGNIRTLYDRLVATIKTLPVTGYELLFVNDGSKDNSAKIIKHLRENDTNVHCINLARNFGHQIAVSAGLDFCTGDIAVIIDADLQDPPEIISQMLEKWKEGFEVVYAQRLKRKGEGLLKRSTANFFYRILKKITAIDIPVDTGDFRLVDKKVIQSLRRMNETHRFIRGLISWVGYNQTSVSYVREERFTGKSKYSYTKLFRLAWDGITSFSSFPLKLASWMGLIFSTISFFLIIWVLLEKFVFHTAQLPGWASIMITVLFIGSIQLLSLGIIGEYISRIANDVRRRPLYIVRDLTLEIPKNEK